MKSLLPFGLTSSVTAAARLRESGSIASEGHLAGLTVLHIYVKQQVRRRDCCITTYPLTVRCAAPHPVNHMFGDDTRGHFCQTHRGHWRTAVSEG